jgi:hypothetical protein
MARSRSTTTSLSVRSSVALGRKDWLFAGPKAGGERAATLYTIIETAKLNGVDPQAYIADVAEKIAGDWPASRWHELMPGTGNRPRHHSLRPPDRCLLDHANLMRA